MSSLSDSFDRCYRTVINEHIFPFMRFKITPLVLALVFLSGSVAFAASDNSATPAPDVVTGHIIVQFEDDTAPFRIVPVARGNEVAAAQRVATGKGVIYAEPDFIVKAVGSNDAFYADQWSLHNTAQTIHNGVAEVLGAGTLDADIDWEEAYTSFASDTFSEVTVAIIDSGVDTSHPDLDDKMVSGWDYVSNDAIPEDVYGHGTHVAGTAAAETGNSIGVGGVAFPSTVNIMPLRVLNDDGSGYTSNIANAIRDAVDNGAQVINLSLGSYRKSRTMQNAVKYAWQKGAVLVAAAGNDASGAKLYPASYPEVISVAATDWYDDPAYFSNFNSEVDVAAPGVNVLSTFPTHPFTIEEKYGRSQNYDVANGTSMASPHVAGLAALLFAQNASRDNVVVRGLIETSTDDLGDIGHDVHYGWGRINVANALEATFTPPVDDDGDNNGPSCPPAKAAKGKC